MSAALGGHQWLGAIILHDVNAHPCASVQDRAGEGQPSLGQKQNMSRNAQCSALRCCVHAFAPRTTRAQLLTAASVGQMQCATHSSWKHLRHLQIRAAVVCGRTCCCSGMELC